MRVVVSATWRAVSVAKRARSCAASVSPGECGDLSKVRNKAVSICRLVFRDHVYSFHSSLNTSLHVFRDHVYSFHSSLNTSLHVFLPMIGF